MRVIEGKVRTGGGALAWPGPGPDSGSSEHIT